MVVEIGAGTLERNPIRYWVKQVYVALLKPFIDDRFQQFC